MATITIDLPDDVYETVEQMTSEQGYENVEDCVTSILSMHVQPFDEGQFDSDLTDEEFADLFNDDQEIVEELLDDTDL